VTHGPLTWLVLGAALATLLVAPAYYRLGRREGREAALRYVEQRARRAGRP
jgi:hypothetical protein